MRCAAHAGPRHRGLTGTERVRGAEAHPEGPERPADVGECWRYTDRMLDHTGIVVSDLVAAKRFYEAVAAPLGLSIHQPHPEFFLLGKGPGALPYLWIGTLRPSYWVEGSRTGINQMHVAFVAPSKEAVHAFHRAAIAAGGRDFGAPGPRDQFGYYGAFTLDPDGNNVEACFRE